MDHREVEEGGLFYFLNLHNVDGQMCVCIACLGNTWHHATIWEEPQHSLVKAVLAAKGGLTQY